MTPDTAGHALAAYFPEHYAQHRGAPLGAHISLFDHWLTQAESRAVRVMGYQQARAHNALADYCDGEQRFLRLYETLARAGLVCHQSGEPRQMEGDEPVLCEIFRASLREQALMDVYFKASATRILGRWDRTDYVIFTEHSDIASFQAIVEGHGLHLLFDPAVGVAH
jgi:hypothetical protein